MSVQKEARRLDSFCYGGCSRSPLRTGTSSFTRLIIWADVSSSILQPEHKARQEAPKFVDWWDGSWDDWEGEEIKSKCRLHALCCSEGHFLSFIWPVGGFCWAIIQFLREINTFSHEVQGDNFWVREFMLHMRLCKRVKIYQTLVCVTLRPPCVLKTLRTADWSDQKLTAPFFSFIFSVCSLSRLVTSIILNK